MIGSLLEVDPRRRPGSAEEALTALRERPPTSWDRRRSDEIEVFDQLPALPDGWTRDGPQQPTPMAASPQHQPVQQHPRQQAVQQPSNQQSFQHRPDPVQTGPLQPGPLQPGPLQHGQQQPTPVGHRAAPTPTTLRTSAVARKRPAMVVPLLLIGLGLILIVVAVLLLT